MTIRGHIATIAALLALSGLVAGCSNPFAPKLDDSHTENGTALGDQRTIRGVFQNIQYAYTYRDTVIYGNLLHPDFQFRYYNSDRATEASFNRDEEMRITHNLFKGADQIDLQWNDILRQDGDSLEQTVTRSYNLKVVLPPNEVFRIDGRATLQLVRNSPSDVWLIRLWRDDSSF